MGKSALFFLFLMTYDRKSMRKCFLFTAIFGIVRHIQLFPATPVMSGKPPSEHQTDLPSPMTVTLVIEILLKSSTRSGIVGPARPAHQPQHQADNVTPIKAKPE